MSKNLKKALKLKDSFRDYFNIGDSTILIFLHKAC